MSRLPTNKTFISVCEIIAAYFTDKFINDLYYKARMKASTGSASVTDEYKDILMKYSYGISAVSSKCKQEICELHKYYQQVTKFSSITYSEFEDNILKLFIPPKYYKDFSSSDKSMTLAALLISCVQTSVVFIMKVEMLNYIIDRRSTNSGYEIGIQNYIVDNLTTQKQGFYIDFAKKINEKSQRVPIEIVQKMRDEIKNQVERRIKAEKERDKALSIIHQLLEKIKIFDTALNKPVEAPKNTLISYNDYSKGRNERQKGALSGVSAPKPNNNYDNYNNNGSSNYNNYNSNNSNNSSHNNNPFIDDKSNVSTNVNTNANTSINTNVKTSVKTSNVLSDIDNISDKSDDGSNEYIVYDYNAQKTPKGAPKEVQSHSDDDSDSAYSFDFNLDTDIGFG